MKKCKSHLILFLCWGILPNAFCQPITGGQTLLESFGARAFSLGEAMVATSNDAAGMGYNPATLDTLRHAHGIFSYQRGISNDSFGQFIFGTPLKHGTMGMSVSYYNAGKITIDDSLGVRAIDAQKDLVLSASWARHVSLMSVGLTGKYLSIDLGGIEKAKATAMDVGILMTPLSGVGLGVSFQNWGDSLELQVNKERLPRLIRLGTRLSRWGAGLSVESLYFDNQDEWGSAWGLEIPMGLFSFRTGYQDQDLKQELTIGMGMRLSNLSIDYAFGMADKLEDEHRISLGLRFQESLDDPIVSYNDSSGFIPLDHESQIQLTANSESHQIYVVQPGDTLKQLAHQFYGDALMRYQIIQDNAYLFQHTFEVIPGQSLVIR